MTQSVCLRCGAMKTAPLVKCIGCSAQPGTDDEFAISMAMTAEHFGFEQLHKLSAMVRAGATLQLSEPSRARLLLRARSGQA